MAAGDWWDFWSDAPSDTSFTAPDSGGYSDGTRVDFGGYDPDINTNVGGGVTVDNQDPYSGTSFNFTQPSDYNNYTGAPSETPPTVTAPSNDPNKTAEEKHWYTNPGVIGGILTAGTALLSKNSDINMQKEALKRQEETAKFNALIELAKLKYGAKGGGGGGGGGASSAAIMAAYANAINALGQGQKGRSEALQGISQGIAGAYK